MPICRLLVSEEREKKKRGKKKKPSRWERIDIQQRVQIFSKGKVKREDVRLAYSGLFSR